MLVACEFDLAPNREIVVAGNPDQAMIRQLWQKFDPNRILLKAAPEIAQYHPAVTDLGKGTRGGVPLRKLHLPGARRKIRKISPGIYYYSVVASVMR